MSTIIKIAILWFCLLLSSCASLGKPDAEISAQPEPVFQKDAAAWFQLGNRYAEQDQLAMAEHAYRQALLPGIHARALHNLGLVQIRLGVAALKKARQELPENASAQAATDAFVRLILLSALSQQPDN